MANRGGATRPNGPNAGNKICQFKLVLLGESAVGKSSLVLRFVKGQFHEFQESTIGGKVMSSNQDVSDNLAVLLVFFLLLLFVLLVCFPEKSPFRILMLLCWHIYQLFIWPRKDIVLVSLMITQKWLVSSYLHSGLPNPNSVSWWYNSEIWNLGHCRPGALPQFGTNVLQRSTSCHCGLRHHKRGTFILD